MRTKATPPRLQWVNDAISETLRRYKECDFLRLPCDYEYGDGRHCIFCGKAKKL